MSGSNNVTAERYRAHRERGNGSIWVLGLGSLVIAVGLLITGQGVADMTQHRADVAAELAALSAVPRPSLAGSPCTLAAEIAAEHRATVRNCEQAGREVEVEVEFERTVFGWPLVARARARAGPSDHPARPAEVDELVLERRVPMERGRSLPGRPPIRVYEGAVR